MRKQYHFRKVENDTYTWDVYRLSRNHSIFSSQTSSAIRHQESDEAYWYPYTHPTTQDIIAHMQLILEADLAYPIIFLCVSRPINGWYAQSGKSKDSRQGVHFCGSI